jgi:hypothetical protein
VFSFQFQEWWMFYLSAAGLNRSNQALQHCGNFFGLGDHLAGLFLIQKAEFRGNVGLGSKLSVGPFSDSQKADKIALRVSFLALGNIGWHGQSRTLHLIP